MDFQDANLLNQKGACPIPSVILPLGFPRIAEDARGPYRNNDWSTDSTNQAKPVFKATITPTVSDSV
ncbi:hypothetical protein DY000_02031234 [Brassica cretica]|uniref:Uncharacterized protein n=1 Tax=Brassica cretica TaxID=69181 RepID=A0ABQ7DT50_BRACR|nr:hypothetical protein DY000_02031234 [Brassica cretica]